MRRSRRSTGPWPSASTTSGCVSAWGERAPGGCAGLSRGCSSGSCQLKGQGKPGEALLPLQALVSPVKARSEGWACRLQDGAAELPQCPRAAGGDAHVPL